MRNKILIATLMLVALIASACGGGQMPTSAPAKPTAPLAPVQPAATDADTLTKTSWILTTLNGQPALEDTTVTLNFATGKAVGSDGCNNYNTSYTADGANVTFKQPIATTMMACPDPIMKQADAYLKVLGQAAKYQSTGAQLTLSDASGKALATFAAQGSDLSGTSWIATGYNNGKQAVVSVAPDTEITANFGADGKLTGSAGCNSYTVSYETSGKAGLEIGPAATTMKACEPAVMDQETQYLAALQTVATYRIDGNKLELRTADGALAATFQKAASSGLSGTSWDVTGYNNGKGAVVSLMLNTTMTANFGTDGHLNGNAGCNDYSTTYQTTGSAISIGEAVATTRTFCPSPEGVMDQEVQYLAALQTAATYRIDGSKLELRTAAGALAASFQKAPVR